MPYALQNASHSAALFRQSASAAFMAGGTLGIGEMTVAQQASPNMSVILGAGRAKVPGTAVSPPAGFSWTTQAMYDVLNDAPLTLTISAANPTNPRIDAVYVGVQDSFYSGATNTALAGVVAGTPAASPVAPAIPSNSLLVATVAVAANATQIVTANIATNAVQAQLNLIGQPRLDAGTAALVITTTQTAVAIGAREAVGLTYSAGVATIVTAGDYLVSFSVQGGTGGSAEITIAVLQNGSQIIGGQASLNQVSSTDRGSAAICRVVTCAAGDTITFATQSSVGLTTGAVGLSMVKVS